MDVEIELVEDPTFTLRMTTGEVSGFKVAAQWEGLIKLVNQSGQAVLLAPGQVEEGAAPLHRKWKVVGPDDGLAAAIRDKYGVLDFEHARRTRDVVAQIKPRRARGVVDIDTAVGVFCFALLGLMGLHQLLDLHWLAI